MGNEMVDGVGYEVVDEMVGDMVDGMVDEMGYAMCDEMEGEMVDVMVEDMADEMVDEMPDDAPVVAVVVAPVKRIVASLMVGVYTIYRFHYVRCMILFATPPTTQQHLKPHIYAVMDGGTMMMWMMPYHNMIS